MKKQGLRPMPRPRMMSSAERCTAMNNPNGRKGGAGASQSMRPLYGAGAVTLAVLILTILVLCLPKGARTEFIPPPFDGAAVVGVPSVPAHLDYGEVYREGMAFSAWGCGNVTLDGHDAAVYLTNPDTNHVWMKLRIMDAEGHLLGETGLIKPGEYVQSAALSAIPAVGETVKMKIMTYEPETYYSAGAVTVNTRIGVP